MSTITVFYKAEILPLDLLLFIIGSSLPSSGYVTLVGFLMRDESYFSSEMRLCKLVLNSVSLSSGIFEMTLLNFSILTI